MNDDKQAEPNPLLPSTTGPRQQTNTVPWVATVSGLCQRFCAHHKVNFLGPCPFGFTMCLAAAIFHIVAMKQDSRKRSQDP